MEKNEELRKKLKEIDDIVKDLSEPLKTIATTRLIKDVFGSVTKEETHHIKSVEMKKGATNESGFQDILSSINKTEHPEIYEIKSVMDLCLFALKIAKDRGKDGLTPAEIYSILFEIFRVKVNIHSINMALRRDKYYVERKGGTGKRVVKTYYIVKKGEDQINQKLSEIHGRNPVGASNTTGEETGE